MPLNWIRDYFRWARAQYLHWPWRKGTGMTQEQVEAARRRLALVLSAAMNDAEWLPPGEIASTDDGQPLIDDLIAAVRADERALLDRIRDSARFVKQLHVD